MRITDDVEEGLKDGFMQFPGVSLNQLALSVLCQSSVIY
jgi:hypothetical protein